jgi:hypothetical protein
MSARRLDRVCGETGRKHSLGLMQP